MAFKENKRKVDKKYLQKRGSKDGR